MELADTAIYKLGMRTKSRLFVDRLAKKWASLRRAGPGCGAARQGVGWGRRLATGGRPSLTQHGQAGGADGRFAAARSPTRGSAALFPDAVVLPQPPYRTSILSGPVALPRVPIFSGTSRSIHSSLPQESPP